MTGRLAFFDGGDLYAERAVTVHTVVFREVFSCAFCTKIPSFTARNGVFCRFCASRSVLLFTARRFLAGGEQ